VTRHEQVIRLVLVLMLVMMMAAAATTEDARSMRIEGENEAARRTVRREASSNWKQSPALRRKNRR